jgi:hypothetical protein
MDDEVRVQRGGRLGEGREWPLGLAVLVAVVEATSIADDDDLLRCFELTFGSVIPSPSTCKDSPMGYTASQTVTAKVVGLGFVRGVMAR